jgi:hypothetical protein
LFLVVLLVLAVEKEARVDLKYNSCRRGHAGDVPDDCHLHAVFAAIMVAVAQS